MELQLYRLNEAMEVEPLPAHDSLAMRWLAATKVGDAWVSTVFLGVPLPLPDGGAGFFEMLIRGSPFDGEFERAASWKEAMAIHARMVQRVADVTGCRPESLSDSDLSAMSDVVRVGHAADNSDR